MSGSARAADEAPGLLTPAEVARLFAVAPQTVSRWASAGKLETTLTRGGHRRFHAAQVYRLLGRDDHQPNT